MYFFINKIKRAYIEQHETDKHTFCKRAVEKLVKNSAQVINSSHLQFWIVTDARRPSDIDYFTINYPDRVKTLRINANDDVRMQRKWKFTIGRFSRKYALRLLDFN